MLQVSIHPKILQRFPFFSAALGSDQISGSGVFDEEPAAAGEQC
jgi:hypothetical protein